MVVRSVLLAAWVGVNLSGGIGGGGFLIGGVGASPIRRGGGGGGGRELMTGGNV